MTAKQRRSGKTGKAVISIFALAVFFGRDGFASGILTLSGRNGGQQKAAKGRSPTSPAALRRKAEWCRVRPGCAWRGASSSGKLARHPGNSFAPVLSSIHAERRRICKVEDAVDARRVRLTPVQWRPQRGELHDRRERPASSRKVYSRRVLTLRLIRGHQARSLFA